MVASTLVARSFLGGEFACGEFAGGESAWWRGNGIPSHYFVSKLGNLPYLSFNLEFFRC